MKTNNILINCKDLEIGYDKKKPLSTVNLSIEGGSLWGVIGPNGSGKTTLIRTVMGIIAPTSGEFYCKPNIKFGYVKQRQNLDTLYPFSVFEVVIMGRYGCVPLFQKPSKKDINKAKEAMLITGVWGLKDKVFKELSGGQKQRALIARALCAEPDLIVLDEPTNDMDIAGEHAVLTLLKKINNETDCAIIIVSHLLPVVLNIAENIIFMQGDMTNTVIYKRDDLIRNNHLERFYNIPIRIVKNNEWYSVLVEKGENNTLGI